MLPRIITGWVICMAFCISFLPDLTVLQQDKLRTSDFGLILVLCLATRMFSPRRIWQDLREFPLARWFLLLLAWDLLCLFLSGNRWMTGSLYLVRRATFFLMAYAGFVAARGERSFRAVSGAFLLSTALLTLSVLLDVAQKWRYSEYLMREQLRADGLFFLGQEFSSGLTQLLALCLWIALWPVLRRGWLLLLVVVPPTILAVLCSGTKTLLFALLFVLASSLRRQSRLPLWIPGCLLIVGLLLTPSGLRQRLLESGHEVVQVARTLAGAEVTLDPKESSLAARLANVSYAAQVLIPKSPWLGHGTGQPPLGYLDNFYLTEAVHHGIPGLVLFLALLYRVHRQLLQSARSTLAWEAAAARGLQWALATLLLAGVACESFYLVRPMEAFWLLVGLHFGLARPTSQTSSHPRGWMTRLALLLMLALLPGLFGVHYGQRPVQRGVNDAGAEFEGAGGDPVRNRPIHLSALPTRQYVGQSGLQVIRLCLSWESLQPQLGGPLDPEVVSQVRDYLESLPPLGVKAILDIHNSARYLEKFPDGSKVLRQIGSTELPISMFADFWAQMSRAFQDQDLYAYGLMNEPHNIVTQVWKEASQAALTSIRQQGDRHHILVPGSNWSSTKLWVECHGHRPWIVDPLDNFAYEGHLYFDQDGGGSYRDSLFVEEVSDPKFASRSVDRLRPFVDWCLGNGVRGFIGEVGCPEDPAWCRQLEAFLQELDRVHMGATLWALGDRWPKDYPLLLQPHEGGRHRPQMEVLLRHRGGRTSNWRSDWWLGYEIAYRRLRHWVRHQQDRRLEN